MIRKIVDQYLENLSGYINVDDKLVTYKWLSKELGIHVNLAKQILWEYWTERGKDENLVATYVLMGRLENGNIRIEVVRETDLMEATEKFNKIISKHIYSLQKTLPDLGLLVDGKENVCEKAAIRCNESLVRSEYEFDVLRWGKVLAAKRSTNSEIPSTKNQTPTNRTDKDNKRSTNEQPTEEKSVASEEKTQKNAFNNMFAKAKDKQKKQTKSLPLPNKTKNMMNFFGSSTQTKQSKDISSEKPEISEEAELKESPKKIRSIGESNHERNDAGKGKEKSPVDEVDKGGKSPAKRIENEKKSSLEKTKKDKELPAKKTEKEKQSPVGKNTCAKKEDADDESSPKSNSASKKVTAVKSKTKSKGKKLQNSDPKESPKNQKKRKRILVIDSSEEESSEEESEPMVPEHFQPEESNVVENKKRGLSPPSVRRENGRRKIRKLIDKTFTDDDGFLVTTKEYVYESCSDREEETPPSVEPVPEPAAKNSNKRKQATLLNFFRKT